MSLLGSEPAKLQPTLLKMMSRCVAKGLAKPLSGKTSPTRERVDFLSNDRLLTHSASFAATPFLGKPQEIDSLALFEVALFGTRGRKKATNRVLLLVRCVSEGFFMNVC